MSNPKKIKPSHKIVPSHSMEPSFRTGWPELDRVFDVLSRDFDRAFPTFPLVRSPFTSISSFPYDMVDEGDKFVIKAEMPGVNKEDIKLNLTENNIEISAEHREAEEETKKNYLRRERREISYQRSFPFPERVDPSKTKAKLENGILNIEVPKVTPTPQPKSTSVPVE